MESSNAPASQMEVGAGPLVKVGAALMVSAAAAVVRVPQVLVTMQS